MYGHTVYLCMALANPTHTNAIMRVLLSIVHILCRSRSRQAMRALMKVKRIGLAKTVYLHRI